VALTGIQVAEERPLAGRLTRTLYLAAAASALMLPLLPGVQGGYSPALLGVALLGVVWGIASQALVPWQTAPGWVTHASSVYGLLAVAVLMHETGGPASPTRFFLFFVICYSAYFYAGAEARVYPWLCLAVQASPALYGAGALKAGLAGELLIVGPVFLVLSELFLTAKRQMLALRAQADDLARRDHLTGLGNRRALMEALAAWERVPGRRRGDRLGLLLLDLDDFKRINTVHGHPGGDRALVAVAGALRAVSRAGDTLARLGGDEFALLMPGATEETMESVADRALAAVRGADVPGGRISASAGWALSPADLLPAADDALRHVKAGGKDAVRAAA
jgi:diguanylate cyclase (GGDEF)-like protein